MVSRTMDDFMVFFIDLLYFSKIIKINNIYYFFKSEKMLYFKDNRIDS